MTKSDKSRAPAKAARAAAIGLLALAGGAYAAYRYSTGADRPAAPAPLMLLYVGAEDCAPCSAWRRDHRAGFLAGLDPSRITYREVIAARTASAFEEEAWPEDLHAQRIRALKIGGVPQWIVSRGGRSLLAAGGLSQWEARILPLIRREGSRS